MGTLSKATTDPRIWYLPAAITLIGGTIGTILLAPNDLLLLLVAAIGLFLVTILLFSPRIWATITVLSFPYWILSGADPQLRIDELLLAAFYLGSIALWFAQAWLRRQQIIHSEIDAAILIFFAFSGINFLVAVLNDVPPLRWMRAWALIATLLLYFPLRDSLQSERSQRQFLLLFLLTTLLAAGATAYQYWLATTNIIYAYQVISARVTTNTALFLGAAIVGLLAALSVPKRWQQILLFLYQTLMAVALLVSFSRGFWIPYFIAVTLLFWYLPKHRKFLLLTFALMGVILATTVTLLFFRDYADIALRMIELRFTSIGRGTQDISLQARLNESAVVLQMIAQHPITGYGLGSEFVYYSPIEKRHVQTFYIHNTYLYLATKLGIPVALLFIFILGTAIQRGLRWSQYAPSLDAKIFLQSSALVVLAFSVLALTNCILYDRATVLTLSIAFLLLHWGLRKAGYQWKIRYFATQANTVTQTFPPR